MGMHREDVYYMYFKTYFSGSFRRILSEHAL